MHTQVNVNGHHTKHITKGKHTVTEHRVYINSLKSGKETKAGRDDTDDVEEAGEAVPDHG